VLLLAGVYSGNQNLCYQLKGAGSRAAADGAAVAAESGKSARWDIYSSSSGGWSLNTLKHLTPEGL